MKSRGFTVRTGWQRLISQIALGLTLAAVPAMGVENIAPDADLILKSMSSFLDGTKVFRINADIDVEQGDFLPLPFTWYHQEIPCTGRLTPGKGGNAGA